MTEAQPRLDADILTAARALTAGGTFKKPDALSLIRELLSIVERPSVAGPSGDGGVKLLLTALHENREQLVQSGLSQDVGDLAAVIQELRSGVWDVDDAAGIVAREIKLRREVTELRSKLQAVETVARDATARIDGLTRELETKSAQVELIQRERGLGTASGAVADAIGSAAKIALTPNGSPIELRKAIRSLRIIAADKFGNDPKDATVAALLRDANAYGGGASSTTAQLVKVVNDLIAVVQGT